MSIIINTNYYICMSTVQYLSAIQNKNMFQLQFSFKCLLICSLHMAYAQSGIWDKQDVTTESEIKVR
jgi:hypothetical protein